MHGTIAQLLSLRDLALVHIGRHLIQLILRILPAPPVPCEVRIIGDKDGQIGLAGLHESGRGVSQDDQQAALWYRKQRRAANPSHSTKSASSTSWAAVFLRTMSPPSSGSIWPRSGGTTMKWGTSSRATAHWPKHDCLSLFSRRSTQFTRADWATVGYGLRAYGSASALSSHLPGL